MKCGKTLRRLGFYSFAASTLVMVAILVWSTKSDYLVDPDALWAEAQRALSSGTPELAASKLKAIRRIRSPNSRDRMLEAQIEIANGQPEEAVSSLGSIPIADPLASQAALLAGRVERRRGRLYSAEIQFRRAIEIDPKLLDAHRELIYIYGIQSRRREVDAEFQALARLTNLSFHDLFTWSFTQLSPFRSDDAKFLREFVAAEPSDTHSRLALAEILLTEGGNQDELDRLMDGLPDTDPEVLATRARIAFSRGQPELAEGLLKRATSDHAGLNRIRGKLAVYRHDYAAAAVYYDKAIRREPYDRVTALELGQALALAGEKEAAARALARARTLHEIYSLINQISSPDREADPTTLIKVGGAYEKAGLFQEATHWLALAVDRDPLNVEAGRCLRRVRARAESEKGS